MSRFEGYLMFFVLVILIIITMNTSFNNDMSTLDLVKKNVQLIGDMQQMTIENNKLVWENRTLILNAYGIAEQDYETK